MARPANGQIIEHRTKAGTITRTLRFRVNGERHRKGLGVVSREEAERQLDYVLADVARGTYEPARPAPMSPKADGMPGFHEFADEWWERRKVQLAEKTREDYEWRLEVHLIPFFAETPIDQIDVDQIDRYVSQKLSAGLSPRSVNMTITTLGAILENALERELIGRNPARGKNRRAKEHTPERSYLDTAAQIEALLDAAGELDAKAQSDKQHVARRAMLATLTFAGLRISELLALRWRDLDLANGWLTVGQAKTDAGRRKIKIRGALRDELVTLKARGAASPAGYVFATSTGQRFGSENFRNRVLAAAVRRANETLSEHDEAPLPRLTPHGLRRTFASLLYALGEPPTVVMAEMGHTTPGLALNLYAKVMRRGEDENAALAALVEGSNGPMWADEASKTETQGEPAARQ
jgi:integrase